ncbi:atrial natriuretic peptide receptor 1-like [Dreissena polymorpha]|uniref:atrial natriuretic peptide receptor 1-like n=1 Tax=Dreissena polymorpha TaxID=45954 RepID=UPI002264A597|nr:atrial natriuretic peptide receptor 1-like [Dreissena polymorpha]
MKAIYSVIFLTWVIAGTKATDTNGNITTIKIGILLMTSAVEPFDRRRAGPAIEIGIEHAERNFGIRFDYIYHNYTGYCPKETAVGHLSQLYYQSRVQAVIGPACSAVLVAVGRLAEFLKLPIVTGLGDLVVRDPDDADMYRTLTILSYNIRKLSNSLSAILSAFDWKHTAILYDITYVFFDLAGSNLVNDFRSNTDLARPYDIPFNPQQITDYAHILMEASKHARVFIILCDSDVLRHILYRAYYKGMAEGDYVFITMELFPSDWLGYYMKFLRGDEKDTAVTKAYESLLLLTLRQPDNPEYTAFADEVKVRARRDYGYEFGSDEEVNYFITAFYDSAIYLAKSYRTILDEGGDVNDGMAVAQRLWNGTFEGITGPVKVDAVGSREADFDLFDMISPLTRQFQKIGRFRGATQLYVPTEGVAVVWPKGLPPDMPTCGYTGALCIVDIDDNTTLITVLSITLTGMLAVVSTAIIVLYRKIKLAQEIDQKSWLFQYEDVKLRKTRLNDSFMSKSLLTMETRMQLLSNANIAKFVGACLQPNSNVLLMEYCSRGSLQDMLQNDSIELDWAFKYSLINDIIKGMLYLHSSPLKLHGRLSSTNCVIDARFALKLTDYGPHLLLEADREVERKECLNDRTYNIGKLLWTAPEHLRGATGFIGASQKGDIYSFAIILQEIAMRSGPFEGNAQVASDVIDLVRNVQVPPFRPFIPDDSCIPVLRTMIETCWVENPADRPSFGQLEESFRRIRAGKTTNIMDNLLQRMSNYADNLEQLASERTKAYLEEKQKVEELLHRLLPKSVACQLQAGKSVIPETFDCVTVYFSDIVGFTSICSRSAPIEVVDFLNDLYTAFDNAIEKFSVYKVETIGDAYMCVSGLPERIGNSHVTEIADMSLAILETVGVFIIRHLPNEHMRVRIGLNSGPVVAGVVGLTMPRYCLFGDTVNTASRMESTSLPMRIHLSESTAQLLQTFPEYVIEPREKIEVKGKGLMNTYWLNESMKTCQTP